MSTFDFADRYAQAGLKPTPEIIEARKASFERIRDEADKKKLLDLVAVYYGLESDLSWFRDELREEDPTFSLVSNERESVLLAAIILAYRVANGDPISILGLVAGSVQGKRVPTEHVWLLDDACAAMLTNATTARVPQKLTTPIRFSTKLNVSNEIATEGSDTETLGQVLIKVHNENQSAARIVAKQVTDALLVLEKNAAYQREESQILWWLFGEHSRSLSKPFSAFLPAQAALVGGIELGELSTASVLGPVAAPAVLDRVLRGAKADEAHSIPLMSAIDDFGDDLAKLKPLRPERYGICPILTAIEKAREIGAGAWGNVFQTTTGLDALLEFNPMELALQVYYEYLLGNAE
jgi:hypothetical protein